MRTAFRLTFAGLAAARNYTENKDVACIYDAKPPAKNSTASIVWLGQFGKLQQCLDVVLNDSRTTAYTWFDPSFNHASDYASGCYARIDGKYPTVKKGLAYAGTVSPAGPPTPPTPPPPTPAAPTPATPTPAPATPTPPPAPTPAVPTVTHTTVTAPAPFKAGASPQGTAVRGVFYFLPTPGSAANFITYCLKSSTWGTIPIPPTSGVMDMLTVRFPLRRNARVIDCGFGGNFGNFAALARFLTPDLFPQFVPPPPC
jgi:hypothetical protein